MPDDIEGKVIELIAEKLGLEKDEVTPETSFVEDLKTDSLDLVDLIMAFEEEFDLDIPDEDAENIVLVKDVITYVKDKTAK